MKTSFITTVLNEENSIRKLIDSLLIQSQLPNEFIIVDGGSTDNTLLTILDYKSRILEKRIKLKIIKKQGNRSVGRNDAIKNAKGDIILCSDAGCVLDKNWVKNITKPFIDSKCEVVAGYYKGVAANVFQKCIIPYVLVMPDRVNSKNFLPATRSIAFKKSAWKKVVRFNENLSHNEDYFFSRKIKKSGINIYFVKNAIAYWIPRNNFKDAFIMFFRFALGDSEAKAFRPKMFLIFIRYILYILLIVLFILYKSLILLNILFFCLLFYVAWSISKNYKYVKRWEAIFYLPSLQLISDFAIIFGTTIGILKININLNKKNQK